MSFSYFFSLELYSQRSINDNEQNCCGHLSHRCYFTLLVWNYFYNSAASEGLFGLEDYNTDTDHPSLQTQGRAGWQIALLSWSQQLLRHDRDTDVCWYPPHTTWPVWSSLCSHAALTAASLSTLPDTINHSRTSILFSTLPNTTNEHNSSKHCFLQMLQLLKAF